MKIDSSVKPKAAKSAKSKGKGKASSSARASKGSSSARREDSVQVTDHAETLGLIKEMVDQTPDVRVGEVDRIMRDLRGGRFKIDFEKVAEGFIKEAVENEMARRMGKS